MLTHSKESIWGHISAHTFEFTSLGIAGTGQTCPTNTVDDESQVLRCYLACYSTSIQHVRRVLGKAKTNTRFITVQGAYPIYLTSFFSPGGFSPVQNKVQATRLAMNTSKTWYSSGAEAGNNQKHQLVLL